MDDTTLNDIKESLDSAMFSLLGSLKNTEIYLEKDVVVYRVRVK